MKQAKNIVSFLISELVEGLTRAQRRLEDQRGTEINFELPDFLKNKEIQQNTVTQLKQAECGTDARFILEETTSSQLTSQEVQTISAKRDLGLYENRTVLVPEERTQTSLQKTNQKVAPSPENSSTASSPMKDLNNTVIENQTENRQIDPPPPLPPKPKIVPMKPQNWGQFSGFSKFKDLKASSRNQTMFLEQPSSSFV